MKAITDITIKDGGGEQFQDMDLGGIHEWIDTTPEKLTEDSLIEMSSSKSVPNDEEEDGKETVPETNWQYKCGRRFLIIQDYFYLLYDMDPSMTHVLKWKEMVGEGLVSYI